MNIKNRIFAVWPDVDQPMVHGAKRLQECDCQKNTRESVANRGDADQTVIKRAWIHSFRVSEQPSNQRNPDARCQCKRNAVDCHATEIGAVVL